MVFCFPKPPPRLRNHGKTVSARSWKDGAELAKIRSSQVDPMESVDHVKPIPYPQIPLEQPSYPCPTYLSAEQLARLPPPLPPPKRRLPLTPQTSLESSSACSSIGMQSSSRASTKSSRPSSDALSFEDDATSDRVDSRTKEVIQKAKISEMSTSSKALVDDFLISLVKLLSTALDPRGRGTEISPGLHDDLIRDCLATVRRVESSKH